MPTKGVSLKIFLALLGEKLPSFLGEVTRVAKGKTQKAGEHPPNQTTSMSVLWH